METNRPNETTQQMEQLRKDRLKEAYTKQKNKGKPKEEEEIEENSDNVEEKSEKKLDNDQKNDYIDSETTDDVDSKNKELFEKQFKGDPLKAVKSWRETQREYMKLKNSSKEKDEYFQKLSSLVEQNPLLGEAIEKAENNEDIESFLASRFQESEQDKPTKQSKSKPNVTDDTLDVDEKTLIESGYLDENEKSFANAQDWQERKRQASIRYMYNELPNRLAQQTAQQYEKQIEQLEQKRREEQTQKKNKELIEKRYLDGIEQITNKYGLDFVNNDEHKSLLKEIDRRAASIRDVDNPAVIDEEAVEMATERVLRSNGLLDQVKQQRQPEKPDLYDKKNSFNVSSKRDNSSSKPKTVADKLKNRHLESYERQIAKRVNTKKND